MFRLRSSLTANGTAGVAATPVAPPGRAHSEAARFLPRVLLAPAVVTLFLWMIVPLVMTIYFSLIRYNLMQPGETGFIGLANYEYFVTDPCTSPRLPVRSPPASRCTRPVRTPNTPTST